jgi:hypothetical protein
MQKQIICNETAYFALILRLCLFFNLHIFLQFSLDTDTISEHRDGWSDWDCKKQGEFCFKSRTCNSTADFNCSKTSEVTVTNCPCAAGITSFLNYHFDYISINRNVV